jgi:cell division protein FtsI (penicillin-binding protein 3)
MVLRRVIEPTTAATLTAMLERVVSDGTAKAGRIAGYMAAGKTGTAKKVDPNGGYSAGDYNSSFVGFVPSRRPEYTIFVLIDTPRRGSYGGAVAAPVFRRIAESLLLRDGVMPTTNPEPPIVVRDRGPIPILPATPAASAALLPAALSSGGPSLMPDVRGLAAREALGVLQRAGLYARIAGHGTVARQKPEPGQPIEAGLWSVLELERDTGLIRGATAP